MRRVDVGGATLALREWGLREAPLILFWHALGPAASGALTVEAGERLAERGWRVVAPDGPGFGASGGLPAERYAISELARLWLALLDELGAGRAVFIGHSWGGVVALHAAALAPDRADALVLLDSGPHRLRRRHAGRRRSVGRRLDRRASARERRGGRASRRSSTT